MSDHTTDTPLRRCRKCGELKPETLEYFNKDTKGRGGLRPDCIPCRAALEAERYLKNRDNKANYADQHREQIRARKAKYYAEHREAIAAHRRETRERRLAQNHRRIAAKRALPSTFTTSEWQACLEYWGYRCAYCGRPRGLWHTLAQDHFIPLKHGGAYTADNILPVCHGDGGCNNRKKHSAPHEWLVRTFGARKAHQIERRVREYFEYVARIKEA